MKQASTSDRLNQIMRERNIKQVDILNLCIPICKKLDVKMNKSDISQYVSGKNEPSQKKLVVLGMALGVTEAWLMGFDVKKERKDMTLKANIDFELLDKFKMLDDRDKMVIMDMIDSMLLNKK